MTLKKISDLYYIVFDYSTNYGKSVCATFVYDNEKNTLDCLKTDDLESFSWAKEEVTKALQEAGLMK